MKALPNGSSALLNAHAPSAAQHIAPIGGADGADISVVVGRFGRLVRCGLLADLRDDPRIRVLAENLDQPSLEAVVTDNSVQVAILDEPDVQSVCPPLRTIAPNIGLLAVTREPTPTYGMALLAWGVSCLDWDATSADVRYAVRLADAGGCMFVSRGDRVECHEWRAEGLLTKRERVVLGRYIEGDSHERIALALKISVSTAKTHTARARLKLRASSRHDLVGIPLLMPDLGPARAVEHAGIDS
ncbi:MAG: response regulator transcription factor [Solirubrobacterales bacterium]|nr:response regulator transcription factor [Solirubrobacterales bacterium]